MIAGRTHVLYNFHFRQCGILAVRNWFSLLNVTQSKVILFSISHLHHCLCKPFDILLDLHCFEFEYWASMRQVHLIWPLPSCNSCADLSSCFPHWVCGAYLEVCLHPANRTILFANHRFSYSPLTFIHLPDQLSSLKTSSNIFINKAGDIILPCCSSLPIWISLSFKQILGEASHVYMFLNYLMEGADTSCMCSTQSTASIHPYQRLFHCPQRWSIGDNCILIYCASLLVLLAYGP